MKTSIEIQTGSRAFFSGIEGFEPHDNDVIIIHEPDEDIDFIYKRYVRNEADNTCEFHIVRRPKEKLIRWELKHCRPMSLCEYLLPEFCQEFEIEFSDLSLVATMKEKLDAKHQYLGIIYDAYIANGSMTLTNEQLMEAYESYRASRGI